MGLALQKFVDIPPRSRGSFLDGAEMGEFLRESAGLAARPFS